MKIVIVGHADSHWIYDIIKCAFLPQKHDVTVISLGNTKYRLWYREHHVRVINTRPAYKWYSKVRGLRTIVSLYLIRKNCEETEADVYLWIAARWFMVLSILKSSILGKTIFYYTGSELMRTSIQKLRLSTGVIKNVKNCIFVNNELRKIFSNAYGHTYKGETHVIDFGVSHLDTIDSVLLSREECKAQYTTDSDKIVVVVGYNARPSQQADRVIEQLATLPKQLKERVFLIIPMQYGESGKNYFESIKREADKSRIQYMILYEYYNDMQMAMFVKATDVFINAQITDAQSAAVIEQLFAGNVVLNAGWLEYSDFIDRGAFYLLFDDFSDIGRMMTDILCNIDEYKNKAKINYDIMKDGWNWKHFNDRISEILSQYT